MQRLVEGVHHFQDIGFKQYAQLFATLKKGQQPEACFITCADSRIVTNLITNTEPGQLFTVRNVGNIVPCYGTQNNGELAAVEFAITALGVQHIVVCGHTGCGAMKQLVAPKSPSSPTIASWLQHADATAEIIREHYSHLKGEALVNAAAEENVLVQIEHLRTLPAVASRISSGKVNLHGWMYKIETGEVFVYEASDGQFVKLDRNGRSNGDLALSGGRNGGANGRREHTTTAARTKV
jgi:carbonic anhydrase